MATNIDSKQNTSVLYIIANTGENDDVIRVLTTKLGGTPCNKDTITLDEYQDLIGRLMVEVDEMGEKQNEGVVEKGSYTIIDPEKKLYDFLHGYHKKVQEREKRQPEESVFAYFIRRLVDAPRSYSRDPTSGKSSHYKKCPDQYGIDFRDKKGKLKSILPPDETRPRMTHLLFGDLSPVLAEDQEFAVFLKMETVGIGKLDEKLTHLLNYVKSRPFIKPIINGVNRFFENISEFFGGNKKDKINIDTDKEYLKNIRRADRKENHIDEEIIRKYQTNLQYFSSDNFSKVNPAHRDEIEKMMNKNPKSIKDMLINLSVFEEYLVDEDSKSHYRQNIKEFKKFITEEKGYDLTTLSYRHGDEIIFHIRDTVDNSESEKIFMEKRRTFIVGSSKDLEKEAAVQKKLEETFSLNALQNEKSTEDLPDESKTKIGPVPKVCS